MASKADMLKAIPKSKLAAAVKKKRKQVPISWNKEKIAEQLSFDELRKLYASVSKTTKKTTAKKTTKKKTTKGVVKGKKTTKRTTKKTTTKKKVKK